MAAWGVHTGQPFYSDSLGREWDAVLERGRRAWGVSRAPFLSATPTTRALDLGVRVLLDHPIEQLSTAGGPVVGAPGLPADVVLSAVDAAHLYADLLPRPRLVPRGRSYSAFALLLALDDPPPMARHTVLFPRAYRGEFDDLRAGRSPRDPAVYVHEPSPGQWFVLLNAPGDCGTGTLEPHSTSPAVPTAIYGTTSSLHRPANRSPVPGLFLVGGTAHPGGDIPLVLRSAASVSAMIGPA